jgi:hypothetical protein
LVRKQFAEGWHSTAIIQGKQISNIICNSNSDSESDSDIHLDTSIYSSNNSNEIWKNYIPHYHACDLYTPPCFIAPFHPRLDHHLFYASINEYFSNINATDIDIQSDMKQK